MRHPDLVALLASLRPAVTERITWPGDVAVEVAAYPVSTPVPPDLVTSVRCIVRVGERIVVCRSPECSTCGRAAGGYPARPTR